MSAANLLETIVNLSGSNFQTEPDVITGIFDAVLNRVIRRIREIEIVPKFRADFVPAACRQLNAA